jgi:galactonate dehydratase
MKIVEAKTYVVGNPWKNWVFVRLETDEGIYGIGEGTLNGFAKTTEACIRELPRSTWGWIRSRSGLDILCYSVCPSC